MSTSIFHFALSGRAMVCFILFFDFVLVGGTHVLVVDLVNRSSGYVGVLANFDSAVPHGRFR